MPSTVKRVGVLTSGGDSPGMNAAVRAVVRTADSLGIETVGVKRGFMGLIANEISPLGPQDVNGLVDRGGTFLYTARSEEFMTEDGIRRAVDNCRYLGIDGMIGIGGDGTFCGLRELSHRGVAVTGIPATIDNDIACTSYTIGFDTACNTAIEAIDRLRDTMQSHERCSVVEVMGHKSGYLALECGVATGATAILIPERQLDFQRDIVDMIRKGRLRGRTHFAIVVAEGAASATDIAGRIREETGIETRVTILGHVQRGGKPLARDRVIASNMGYQAVQVMASGGVNRVICYDGQKCFDMDVDEALQMKKTIDETIYTMMDALENGV